MKIIVYAICKNEAAHVARFCESAKDADEIVVADTGSDDGTQDLLRQYGATVHEISVKPWRFDDARNAALSLLPADADICVSLDLDEILQPGWREEVERAWVPGTTRLRYIFDWGQGIRFFSEKIHARTGYRWHHPCHERIVPDRLTEVWGEIPRLVVKHEPDPSKSRGQYFDLLRISIEEDPNCARNAFYYARELSFYRHWDDAIREGKRYLALPAANWADERCYAMRVIGKSYAEKGDPSEALKWLRAACSEAPGTREPWCDLAEETYKQARWPECYGAALTALRITERPIVYTSEPASWGAKPHDLAAVAAWNLGLISESLKYAKAAIDLDPSDLRLRRNLELIQEQAA